MTPRDSDLPPGAAALRAAVVRHAEHCADADGVAHTRVPGLRTMRAYRPVGPIRSVYRPLVCLVLQGAKRLMAGADDRIIAAGQAVVVGTHLPVTGHILEASPVAPYVAVAIELDMGVMHEIVREIGEGPVALRVPCPVFAESFDETMLSSAARLMRLVDHPEAIPLLRPAILRELHYWLLTSRHGAELRQLCLPSGETQRVTRAIDVLRDRFRDPIEVADLAAIAHLSVSAFRRQFKQLTSLSPVQFQKQLRLTEARRLMMMAGLSAGRAGNAVGYQSASHFSRDFVRMFGAPPRRDRTTRSDPALLRQIAVV